MSIHTSLVDELPAQVRKSARESVCQDIVALAIAEAPKFVRVDADTVDDLVKFYKSMIQYKARHRATVTINMRKAGDTLYIWVTDARERAS